MDEWELDGAHAEIERLAALHQSRRPLYSDRNLSRQAPGTEHFGAPPDAELTAEDLIGAQRELAEKHGISSARVRGMVMLTTARAGLGYSPGEQVQVIKQVMLALDAGKMNVSDAQILALSGRADGTSGAAEDQRAAVRDEAMTLGLSVSQAQRDKFAKSGVALPSGAFPIHDKTHLAAAKSEYAKGNLAGHSKAEVRSHINKRARALGLPGLDEDGDEDGDSAGMTMALTQESAALALAAGSGGSDSAAGVISRHPEFAHLFKAGRTGSGGKHPSGGKKVTSRTRAHAGELEDSPAAEDPAAAIERYTAMRAKEWGGESPISPNRSDPPKSLARRNAEERRSLAGGRPQNGITR